MIDEAYREGRNAYLRHGFDLSVCPYEVGTQAYLNFERGMAQAMRLEPRIHEAKERANKEAEREERSEVKLLEVAKTADRRQVMKRNAYRSKARGE